MRVLTAIVLACVWGLPVGCSRSSSSENNGQSAGSALPPPPSMEGPRLAQIQVPTSPPFVGSERMDAQGYPLRVPDKVALLNLLRIKRFDLLEQFFEFYQTEFERDFHKERWPVLAAQAFETEEPAVGVLLDEWVERSPKAFAAWHARGAYGYDVAWYMRGHGYAKGTSAARLLTMKAKLVVATADLARAVQLRPKLQAARSLQLLIEKTSDGGGLAARALLDASVLDCPACYGVRMAYLHGLEPSWGGTWQEMAKFAAFASRGVKTNPKLELLRGAEAAERCRLQLVDKKPELAKPFCDEALKHGDSPDVLVNAARVARAEGSNLEALQFLERALQLEPQYLEALTFRYALRVEASEFLAAARDLVSMRQLDSADDDTAKQTEWMVKKLNFLGAESAKAGNTEQAAPFFEVGLQLDPDNTELMHRQGAALRNDLPALRARATERPNDFDLHLSIDHALASQGKFDEVVQLWDVFIKAQPQDPRPYSERGGAKWLAKQRDGALADIQKACDMGLQSACALLPQLRAQP
jgi:tetratricopeptide (TPR) repeat protein